MIDPSVLVNAVVSTLRGIPELVQEMGGDDQKIYAYHDSYPKRVSLTHAVHTIPTPGIMAVWNGTGPSSQGAFDVWKHQVSLYIRSKHEYDGDPAAGYYKLFRLVTKGVPTGQEQPMLYLQAHPNFHPMDVPTIQRQTDAEALDYFEVPLTFTEIGDE
jgi:hypothetical protein